MKKMESNNIFVIIIIVVVSIAGISLLAWFGQNNNNNLGIKLEDLLNKSSPYFSFTDLGGKIYSSENLKGKNIVLFFNEGLGCYPACWSQVADFGKDQRFNSNNVVAISVVPDSLDSWRKAIGKMEGLESAIIVNDKWLDVSRKFGTLNTSSSMRKGRAPGHTYVVIDTQGIVRYVFDDPRMGINNDKIFEEILKLKVE